MSEAGDYSPGPWKGHDFASAHRAYDKTAGRSYQTAVNTGKTNFDLLPEFLKTNCLNPLVVMTDQTSSMGTWTNTIFSKLPYLIHEVQTEYLGADAEIAFGAIGDARNHENYPLQVRPFGSGTELKDRLEELVREAKGGGNGGETYELGALYLARNTQMPKAINPICIFIGDEAPFDQIHPDVARDYARVELENSISTEDVFEELKQKFSVYYILKPYQEGSKGDELDLETQGYLKKWVKYVGADHIAILHDPKRVIDVIFGILAFEMGKTDYFREEIEGRQTPRQVDTVYESLSTIHKLGDGGRKLLKGKSTLHKPVDGKGSKPLF